MFGWFRRIGEAIADALEGIRERLFGRREDAEEEELIDEAEQEEAQEDIEELEEELEELMGGEVGDEYIIEQIEEIEEETDAVQEVALDTQDVETESVDVGDDTQIVYELYEETAESLVANEHLLTNAELERAEALLEDAAALMDELKDMTAEDRAAAIGLILEALAEVERIVERAVERLDHAEGGCEDARGPFVAYDDALSYARSIPCPTWIYSDGVGWWWVCMDDCSPERVEA